MAAGGVVVNKRGRILLRKPTGEFGGYVWTFPKGRPDQGESLKQAAIREVEEESGYKCKVVGRIGQYRGDVTLTTMFLMLPVAKVGLPDPETEMVAWVKPERAVQLLSKSKTPRGRERDLKILADAVSLLGEQPGTDALASKLKGLLAQVDKDPNSFFGAGVDEDVTEAKVSSVLGYYVKLEATVIKKTKNLPNTAPVLLQLMQMLGQVREAIRGQETKVGDEAVRIFIDATAKAGFLANFGAPLTQLQKYPGVNYDPYGGKLSFSGNTESVVEMAKLSARGRTVLMRATKEAETPNDEATSWAKTTRAWMSDGNVLEKRDVMFRPIGSMPAGKHSYGWKQAGKIKAALMADSASLLAAMESSRDKLKAAGWTIEEFNTPK